MTDDLDPMDAIAALADLIARNVPLSEPDRELLVSLGATDRRAPLEPDSEDLPEDAS